MTAVDRATPDFAVAEAAATGRVRRLGGALALILAPWGFLIANVTYAWMIRNGGSDETGAQALALAAAGPDLLRLGIVAGMIGCLLIIPAVLTAANPPFAKSGPEARLPKPAIKNTSASLTP